MIDHDTAGNLVADKDGYLYDYDGENRIVRIFVSSKSYEMEQSIDAIYTINKMERDGQYSNIILYILFIASKTYSSSSMTIPAATPPSRAIGSITMRRGTSSPTKMVACTIATAETG